MRICATALSLNVPDPDASAAFWTRHAGFTVAMQDDGFVSLQHENAPNLIFLRTGLPTFKPAHRAGTAGDGLLIAFIVDDVDARHAELVDQGITVVTPPETEPWGERYAQYEDPNGVIMQLVQWLTTPEGTPA